MAVAPPSLHAQELRSLIVNVTGLATMFDTRRTVDYDPTRASAGLQVPA